MASRTAGSTTCGGTGYVFDEAKPIDHAQELQECPGCDECPARPAWWTPGRVDLRGAILRAGLAKYGSRSAFDKAMAKLWGVDEGTVQRRRLRLLGDAPPEHVPQIEQLLAAVGLTVVPIEKSNDRVTRGT